MSKKARRRRIIVKLISYFLIALKYAVGAAILIGLLWLFCGALSIVMKVLGVG